MESREGPTSSSTCPLQQRSQFMLTRRQGQSPSISATLSSERVVFPGRAPRRPSANALIREVRCGSLNPSYRSFHPYVRQGRVSLEWIQLLQADLVRRARPHSKERSNSLSARTGSLL